MENREERIVTGTFIGNPKGFGFVEAEGLEEDLFIPEEEVNGAFHKDTVEAELLGERRGKRREARVIRIVSRGFRQVVGTYERSREHYGFLVPDEKRLPMDIFVPAERSKGAVTGTKAVVEITDYGGKGRHPEGKVLEILGHVNDPGVDVLALIRNYELPVEFGERVLNQAQRQAKEVSEADRAGRLDLRDMLMVTIDGEDAKDLDDAVSLSVEEGYYHLGVHIADVTNYVQENSALDREALKRGTSVYLADRVIPMLPHALSNGICSLNAGEDRLALSCLMTLDGQGEIVDYELRETVIRVSRRMSYGEVKGLLEGSTPGGSIPGGSTPGGRLLRRSLPGGKLPEERLQEGEMAAETPGEVQAAPDPAAQDSEDASILSMLRKMAELSALLRARRKKRGAVDFDFPECKIRLDQEGHPLEILPYERNVATDLIEDFMLAANETVAQHFYWMELPFVYRVHDVPDGEKIRKLSIFLRNFGYYMKAIGRAGSKVNEQEIHPKEIQKLLDKFVGTPEEALISRMTLRSMKRARYSTESTGHFGLACQYYCHFTSPIRRYPDLQIHRILKDQLRGRLNEEKIAHYQAILPEVCQQSSQTECRADEAERETDKMKKAEYMEGHIGEEFDGVISGITSWGIFVELPNTVEGMIHVSKLSEDDFFYQESSGEMVGRETGKTYKLGMLVRIRVTAADRKERAVEFALAEEAGREAAPMEESGGDAVRAEETGKEVALMEESGE